MDDDAYIVVDNDQSEVDSYYQNHRESSSPAQSRGRCLESAAAATTFALEPVRRNVAGDHP
jgi:hypothetical protein